MKEAAVVIESEQAVYWHAPQGRSKTHLPDSSSLWSVLWSRREKVDGVAHTHPGEGWPVPSQEDLTTFSAIERGLGRRLRWWIASDDALVELTWRGPGALDYRSMRVDEAPKWLAPLRQRSKEDET